jgi:hypothetical protein
MIRAIATHHCSCACCVILAMLASSAGQVPGLLDLIENMIFLNAHLEISLLKFNILTLVVEGQPDDHSFNTPLLEMRGHSLRGPLAGHTQISILLKIFSHTLKKLSMTIFLV